MSKVQQGELVLNGIYEDDQGYYCILDGDRVDLTAQEAYEAFGGTGTLLYCPACGHMHVEENWTTWCEALINGDCFE